METDTLKQQLVTCIRDALVQQAYSPPQTRDTSITAAFYAEAADKIVDSLKAEGWSVRPAATLWRDIGDGRDLGVSYSTTADAEEDLRSCIRIAVMLFRSKPPRSRDPAALQRYHDAVAQHVVDKILISNWALIRTLQRIAPAPSHSTPPH